MGGSGDFPFPLDEPTRFGSATLDESTITSTVTGSASDGCTITLSTTLTRVEVVPQGSR